MKTIKQLKEFVDTTGKFTSHPNEPTKTPGEPPPPVKPPGDDDGGGGGDGDGFNLHDYENHPTALHIVHAGNLTHVFEHAHAQDPETGEVHQKGKAGTFYGHPLFEHAYEIGRNSISHPRGENKQRVVIVSRTKVPSPDRSLTDENGPGLTPHTHGVGKLHYIGTAEHKGWDVHVFEHKPIDVSRHEVPHGGPVEHHSEEDPGEWHDTSLDTHPNTIHVGTRWNHDTLKHSAGDKKYSWNFYGHGSHAEAMHHDEADVDPETEGRVVVTSDTPPIAIKKSNGTLLSHGKGKVKYIASKHDPDTGVLVHHYHYTKNKSRPRKKKS